MGVLREDKKTIIRVDSDPHVLDYGDYVFDSDIEESEPDEAPIQVPIVVRRKKFKSRLGDRFRCINDIPKEGTDGLSVKKNMGSRKWRRIENARVLLSFASADDFCNDYSDLVPQTITAFAKLFLDEENMKAWNEFIEKSEEEQEKILGEIDSTKKTSCAEHERSIKSKESSKTKSEDKRAHHPAYSAHACFERLNNKFKTALSKKRVPLNLIDKFENTLREFFEGSPAGVWIETSLDSFQRLYIHAVSNYLMLHSSSITADSSGKMVEIRNRKKFFIPPHTYLVPYLLERFHKPHDEEF